MICHRMNKYLVLNILSFFIIVTLCASCGSRKTAGGEQGDTLLMRHAQLLQMVDFGSYTEVSVQNPWHKGQLLHRYFLVKKGAEPDESSLRQRGTVVRVPLTHTVAFTTVHASLLQQLQAESALAGMADVEYVHSPSLKQLCKSGKIVNVGSSLSPDVERIIALQPDAMFLSPFDNSGGYGKVGELGVPVIECADYMESTALGRAEWIRFYGLLTGREHLADSIFRQVETNYQELCRKASQTKTRPTLLMDKLTGSVWYVPGGKSTLGSMLRDAAVSYVFADDTHAGSVALPFEKVLEQGSTATLWLLRYESPLRETYTLQTLLSEYHGYARMKAFQHGQCYGCDTRSSLFYEEVPFRPDLLLSDFITLAHPELQLGSSRYFIRLPQ